LILAGCWAINLGFFPETRKSVLLRRKATKKKQDATETSVSPSEITSGVKDWSGFLEAVFLRPVKMLFVEPILLLIALYIGLINGIFCKPPNDFWHPVH
jgi:hypothetical protein